MEPVVLRPRYALAALVLALGASAAPACTAPALGATMGAATSRWHEQDAQGRTLVRERGHLPTMELRATTVCDGWTLAGRAALASGRRGYDGVDSRGAALHTHSELQDVHLTIDLLRAVTPDTAVGLRLGQREIRRDIRGTGTVLGYPERFRYAQLALGAQHRWRLTPSLQLGMEAWLGGGPGGHMDLQLPTADAARLTLGTSRTAQATLRLESASNADETARWHWGAELGWRHERLRAGPVTTLVRNGVPVGGAAQPATRLSQLSLQATLRRQF